jgi:hypothetical protein
MKLITREDWEECLAIKTTRKTVNPTVTIKAVIVNARKSRVHA